MALAREQVLGTIGEMLDIDASTLADTDNLIEEGMDSIRVMMVAERWRAEGADIDFTDLLEKPTLRDWLDLLER